MNLYYSKTPLICSIDMQDLPPMIRFFSFLPTCFQQIDGKQKRGNNIISTTPKSPPLPRGFACPPLAFGLVRRFYDEHIIKFGKHKACLSKLRRRQGILGKNFILNINFVHFRSI